MLCWTTSARLDQLAQRSPGRRDLEVDGDADRLPRLQQWPTWLAIQNPSYSVLTLMTSAPRSPSSCVPNGPATASPKSSTTDAGERMRERLAGSDAPAPRRRPPPLGLRRRWRRYQPRLRGRATAARRPRWPTCGTQSRPGGMPFGTSMTHPSSRKVCCCSASSGEQQRLARNADLGGRGRSTPAR